jgi:hypothetical protein
MTCHLSASSPCSQASIEGVYGGKSRDRPLHIVTGELCHATHLRHLLLSSQASNKIHTEENPGGRLHHSVTVELCHATHLRHLPCSQASVMSICGGKSRDRHHHIVKGDLCHATHLRHLLLLVKHRLRIYMEENPGTDFTILSKVNYNMPPINIIFF